MKRRRQEGVDVGVIEFIQKKYKSFMNLAGFMPNAAFQQNSNTIKGITVGGKTVRMLFLGYHVHSNTIRGIVEGLGRKTFLKNGVLYLKKTKRKKRECETLKSQ